MKFGKYSARFGLNELCNKYVCTKFTFWFGGVRVVQKFIFGFDLHIPNTYYKISIFQNTFIKRGGNLRDNCPVKQIFPMDETMVKIELLDGSVVKTKSLVVCAGPWTNKLMNPLG